MAHGVADALTATDEDNCAKMVTKQQTNGRKTVGVMGSRRIFAPAFKLKVLDSYRNDIDCRGNQRATARKYGIHRRQIQKWLQCEDNLRSSCVESGSGSGSGHARATSRSTSATPSPSPLGNASVSLGNSGAPAIEGPREPAPTPAPALNLSRTRLHGDEELSRPAAQLGPPLRHHCLASSRYGPRTPHPPSALNANNFTSLSAMHPPPSSIVREQIDDDRLGSPQNGQPQQRDEPFPSPVPSNHSEHAIHGLRDPTSTVPVRHLEAPSVHRYHHPGACINDEQRVANATGTDNYIVDGSDSTTIKCNQMNPYRDSSATYDDASSSKEQPYGNNNNINESFSPRLSSSSSSSPERTESRSSPTAAAALIKTEPDAVATVATGSCDSAESITGRPSSRSARLSSLPPRGSSSPHRATAASAAVHSERSRTSPLRTHTSGLLTDAVQPGENSGNARKDGSSFDAVRRQQQQQQPAAGSRAYPPTHPHSHLGPRPPMRQPQRTPTYARLLTEDEYCVDLGQPPASVYSASAQCFLPSASPPIERVLRSGPSSPSSPRSSTGPSSSGLSTSSSDSETDALDYSTTTLLTPSNDLARRRSFSLRFKLDVLDAFHRDRAVAGNQRATARKFGINRRQVQKWLSQETELRGEIALRGGVSRQRLGPLSTGIDSPMDLRTNSAIPETIDVSHGSPGGGGGGGGTPLSSGDSYRCYSPDTASSHPRPSYFPLSTETSEILSTTSSGRACNLSCCADNVSCYSQESLRIADNLGCTARNRTCYASSFSSEARPTFFGSVDLLASKLERKPSDLEYASSPLKRSCPGSCCAYSLSPKRSRRADEDTTIVESSHWAAPQDAPLCLVKPKGPLEPVSQPEPVTSTVPTPPAAPAPPSVASTKRDAILFKPYLDNPIAKPVHDTARVSSDHHHHHHQHPNVAKANNPNHNNNNNCQNVRDLNDHRLSTRNDGYALELSLSVPITWAAPMGPYSDISQVGSAFVRYPTTRHYT